MNGVLPLPLRQAQCDAQPSPDGRGSEVHDDLTPTEKIYLPYVSIREQIRQARKELANAWIFGGLKEIQAIQKQIQDLEAEQQEVINSLHQHISDKMKKRTA